MANASWRQLIAEAAQEQEAAHDDIVDEALVQHVTVELTGTVPAPEGAPEGAQPTEMRPADDEPRFSPMYLAELSRQIDDRERKLREDVRPGWLDRLAAFVRRR